ncbi:MAG: hypothetical protein WD749_00845 [Phycisphaerales bacterium]
MPPTRHVKPPARCTCCGYELAGLDRERCPWCAEPPASPPHSLVARSPLTRLALGAGLAAAGCACFIAAAVLLLVRLGSQRAGPAWEVTGPAFAYFLLWPAGWWVATERPADPGPQAQGPLRPLIRVLAAVAPLPVAGLASVMFSGNSGGGWDATAGAVLGILVMGLGTVGAFAAIWAAGFVWLSRVATSDLHSARLATACRVAPLLLVLSAAGGCATQPCGTVIAAGLLMAYAGAVLALVGRAAAAGEPQREVVGNEGE